MRGINRYQTTEWFRACPKYNNEVYHKNKRSLISGHNKICWECRCKETAIKNTGKGNPMFGKHHTEETKNKLKNINTGKKLSLESINKMKSKLKGLKRTDETKEKIRISKMGKNNSFYGKKHTKQTIEKISSKLSVLHKKENNPFYGNGMCGVLCSLAVWNEQGRNETERSNDQICSE